MSKYFTKETLLPTTRIRQKLLHCDVLQLCKANFRQIVIILIVFELITIPILLYMYRSSDSEQILPSIIKQVTAPCPKVRIETEEKFYFADIFAGLNGGGVGNFIFEYMAIIGMAKQLNRTPAVNIKSDGLVTTLVRWQKHFPNMLEHFVFKKMTDAAEVSLPYHGCCKSFNVDETYAPHKNATSVHTKLVYMQSFVFFKSMSRDEVLYSLDFSEDALKTAQLKMVDPAKLKDTHNLCVHIRRGDYLKSNIHMPSTEPFTVAGTLYLVDKLRSQMQNKNLSVIMLGNDLSWEQKLFENITIDFPYHAANQSKDWVPHIDWAFSKLYCDTVLVTAAASTYGWWLAYLSRGQDIYYYEKFSKPGGIENEMDQVTFFPKEWTRLRFNENTTTVTEVPDWQTTKDEKAITVPPTTTTPAPPKQPDVKATTLEVKLSTTAKTASKASSTTTTSAATNGTTTTSAATNVTTTS